MGKLLDRLHRNNGKMLYCKKHNVKTCVTMVQQYSITCIVSLYLSSTCWHGHFSCWKWFFSESRKWTMIDILQMGEVVVMILATVVAGAISEGRLKRKSSKVKCFFNNPRKWLCQLIMGQSIELFTDILIMILSVLTINMFVLHCYTVLVLLLRLEHWIWILTFFTVWRN